MYLINWKLIVSIGMSALKAEVCVTISDWWTQMQTQTQSRVNEGCILGTKGDEDGERSRRGSGGGGWRGDGGQQGVS